MEFREFKRKILNFFAAQGRSFPWRDTFDPYEILVSEIMLQQTQADRVVPKYLNFLSRFPTFDALAAAKLPDVLIVWQGLGYNRRALALKALAEQVSTEYSGSLPSTEAELIALPGIGPYTARAILVFAFLQSHALIETNIRAVYLHHFFADHTRITDRDLLPLILETLPRTNARHWFYALMDYGSHLKKAVPGVGRSSAHYVKQSKFQGSNRQARGALLRALAQHETATLASLIEATGFERARLEHGLAQLLAEGFVKKKGRSFLLAG